MSLWIKICATTSPEDALLAAEAGADAVGFVFARSPRRVTMDQAAAMVQRLPPGLEKIGVFVDAAFEEIARTIEGAGLTGVQLHWDAPAALPGQLRARFGEKLRILRVVHFDAEVAETHAADFAGAEADAILVDSRAASAVGGTGVRFDWRIAAATFVRNAKERKLIAAGGLTPENIDEAIALLNPWGVDVASGVESAPGSKDPAKVRAFIQNARAAGHGN
jgi:phosphoribosylanthranilate isomerase